ncbi:peptidoglycan-binding protein [Streptomyces sp. ISL-10]|uniref:peptidoglycan-binding protein n=1 Tax=Streptomyces sp. ISL-10 TaxID=2819172 RepID=UPI001BE7806F|nr:peptidoglycan-binding protein [Streptomyces sp. ISL-10]MBT2366312.1 peptidoglycan-binding protein [Streptomyces sp. ISL-10]
MTGNSCTECGRPLRADGGAGLGCDCARRAAEALHAERQAHVAAEDFDPLRIRPYVTLPEPDLPPTGPPPLTLPPQAGMTPEAGGVGFGAAPMPAESGAAGLVPPGPATERPAAAGPVPVGSPGPLPQEAGAGSVPQEAGAAGHGQGPVPPGQGAAGPMTDAPQAVGQVTGRLGLASGGGRIPQVPGAAGHGPSAVPPGQGAAGPGADDPWMVGQVAGGVSQGPVGPGVDPGIAAPPASGPAAPAAETATPGPAAQGQGATDPGPGGSGVPDGPRTVGQVAGGLGLVAGPVGGGVPQGTVPQPGPGAMPDLAETVAHGRGPVGGIVRLPGASGRGPVPRDVAAFAEREDDDTHELAPLNGHAPGAVHPDRRRPRRRGPVAVLVGAAVIAVVATVAFAGGLFSGDDERDRVSMPDRDTTGPSLNVGPDGPSAPPSVTGTPSASAAASASASAAPSASSSASARPSVSAAVGTESSGPASAAPSAPPSTAAATGSVAEEPPGRSSTRTLREGDSGPAVTELQLRLAEIRLYEGPADGNYDETVEDAVARFQSARGIKGDPLGVYGSKTRKALESETSEP